MIKDFTTYINEGLFDRNQSEFTIRKTDRGVDHVYITSTKEELYKYIDIAVEQAKKEGTYTDVNLNNIDVSELGNVELEGLFSEDAYTINPDISDWNIKYIPYSFFDHNKQIEEFNIPNSVTSIGNCAFWGCSELSSVTSPNSVMSIGESAFEACSGLTSVTIPNSVTSIGSSAFDGCNGLTKINYTGDIAGWCGINFGNYSANPTTHSPNLYINDVYVKDLVIPNSVTRIGNYAFYCCSGLTKITIPNSVNIIGRFAFAYCRGLTSVTIPNSVTRIGEEAFYGCSSLTSVTIPNNVKSIGSWTFGDCGGLTSVNIPNSVTSIGVGAFYKCSKLTSVTISNNCRVESKSFPKDCKIIRK